MTTTATNPEARALAHDRHLAGLLATEREVRASCLGWAAYDAAPELGRDR